MSTEPANIQNERASLVPLIREAMADGVDPQKLSALLQVRREWEDDEARKAFYGATSEFQRRAPIVAKDDQGEKSKYAKLDRIWRTVRPVMTELGLALTWQICELREGGICHVEGKLSHKLGHFEKITFDVPVPDVIKNREGRAVTNIAQQMGSAHSYAQRYATCSALGIITGEDDDGRAAGTSFISSDQVGEIEWLLAEARNLPDFKEEVFWKWLNLADDKSALLIPVTRYADTVASLKRKLGRAT